MTVLLLGYYYYYYYSLQSFYVLNLNPIALAIREIFTGVRKFKVLPRDLVFARYDLVLRLWIVLYVINVQCAYHI